MRARLAAGRLIAAGIWATMAAAPAGAAPPAAWQEMGVQAYEPPKPAPAFALPALDGRTVRLADFRGKVLVLFFWATW
jgi:cytochrome c biogenesis protein CcmG/thiol:disulfide interchange protein DsbE